MESLDASVSGLGATGNVTAYSLAKAGLQVMLVERAKTPSEKTFQVASSMGKSYMVLLGMLLEIGRRNKSLVRNEICLANS
ncbi:MAG: hypothetical protein ACFE9D_06915 [Promethearchaeota archaeon]